MKFGLDALGAARFADLMVREHPEGWSIGVFSEVFGDGKKVVEPLLKSGRAPDARVQLQWRDSHVFTEADIAPTVREARKWQALSKEFGKALRISPWCEHNARLPVLNKLHQAIMNVLPDCQYVNAPWQGDFMPNVWNEVHGTKRPPSGNYIFSFDGLSAVDANVEAFKAQHSRADTFYLWIPQFNLRKNVNDKTPRPQRKAVPTSNLIDSVIYLHRPRGATKLDRRHLWKSHADQHSVPVPEPRAHKPVFITPVDARRIELVADNGQVVAVMPRTSNFTDGRPLYRLPEFGYLVAEKAIRIHGKPTVKLVANGKEVGIVNCAFRDGSYR